VLANEIIRISLEANVKRVIKEQANPPGVKGMWKELTDNVNAMVRFHL
jgi:osomolarity two-component system sensor histidine kinase NIK1